MLSRLQGKPREEADSWYRSRSAIKPQNFCDVKEIQLKAMSYSKKTSYAIKNYKEIATLP